MTSIAGQKITTTNENICVFGVSEKYFPPFLLMRHSTVKPYFFPAALSCKCSWMCLFAKQVTGFSPLLKIQHVEFRRKEKRFNERSNLLSWFPPQWQNVSCSGIWSPTPTRLEGMYVRAGYCRGRCCLYVRVCARVCDTKHIDVCVWEEKRSTSHISHPNCGLLQATATPPAPPRRHIQTHSDKTVSIIHAYSQDYATVNPSVLPWQWADEKDKGERAVSGKRVGRKAEAEMDSAETELWFSIFIFLGVTRICHQL